MPLPFSRNSVVARPTFQRDFAGLKTLDHGVGPAISFTRGSNATYFDATGTLRFAPNNHIRNSQALGATVGVIGSGGVMPTNWSITSGGGLTREVIGTGTENGLSYIDLKISGTASDGGSIYLTIETGAVAASGQTWTVSSYAKLTSGSLNGFTLLLALQENDSSQNFLARSTTTVTPTSATIVSQRSSVTRVFNNASTARANASYEIDYVNGATIDCTLRIAAPQLEIGSTATDYNPTTGTAYFGPRFDHSGGSSLGLLIEEARTNLLQRSEEFDDAYWTKNNCTISSNATAAPAGGQTADTLFDTSGSSARSLQRSSVTVTTSTAYTITAFAKDAGRRYFHIRSNDNTTNDNGADVVFDLQNGLVSGSATARGTWSAASADIASVGSGWYRCRLTTTVATTLLFVKFQTSETGSRGADGNAGAYTGDITKGIHIWGAQLEAGAFATSYIPTTTAAATRAADSAVVTPISSFYNQAEGTLFVEASRTHTAKSLNFAAFIDGNDLSKCFVIETGVSFPAQQRMQVSGGTGGALLSYADGVANTTYRMIAAFASDDFRGAQNGALTSADNSGTAPTTLTRFNIGMASTNTNSFYNGSQAHIRRVAYWPRRLSNTLLQQLTT